jgi:uncharacterized protein YndB with AHSA1/START domain
MAKGSQVSRHIDAPVERVWALLTDASSYRAWNCAVVSIEGPISKGATIVDAQPARTRVKRPVRRPSRRAAARP